MCESYAVQLRLAVNVLVLVVPYSVHTTQHNKCINIRPQLKSV